MKRLLLTEKLDKTDDDNLSKSFALFKRNENCNLQINEILHN